MRTPTAVLAVVGALLGPFAPAWGQAQPAGPEHVLDHVPAGAVGFVLIEHAGRVAAKADAFLAAVSPPDEPILPVPAIEMIKAQVGMAEGFNPAGGFAAAMLDPKPYGLDLAEMIARKRKDGRKITRDMLPLVALIPGKDPASLFALRKPTVVDGVVQFTGTDKTPRYCLQAGGYVALGANLEAVKAVATATKSIRSRLSEADQAFIKAHDLTIWVDMAKLAPAVDRAARLRKPDAKPAGGMLAALRALKGDPMAQWKGVLGQMASAVAGLRFAKEGLYVDVRGAFRADSQMAKALAAHRPSQVNLLGRLPGPPYVLALGLLNAPKAPETLSAERIDRVLAGPPYKHLPAEAKARYRAAALGLSGQVRSLHVYAGPVSSGLRLAYVIRCESSAKARAQLADIVAVAVQAVEAGADERLKGVSLKHESNAAKVAGKDADVITMSSTAPTDPQRKRARALLGSESIRLLVVEADPQTLLIAQAGDETLLADAMAVAVKGSGTLASQAGVAKALALLPAKRTAAGVLNLRLLQPIIRSIRAASGRKTVDVEVDSDLPFAGAADVSGASVRVTVVMPTETVRAVMKVVSALLGANSEQP